MELRLFIIFRKRIAHRIYPDPANLVCLLLRFFHDLLSSQWVVLHFMSLLCRLSWPTWFQTGCTWGPTRSCQLSLRISLLFWILSSSWSLPPLSIKKLLPSVSLMALVEHTLSQTVCSWGLASSCPLFLQISLCLWLLFFSWSLPPYFVLLRFIIL